MAGLHAFHGRFESSSVRGAPGSNEPAKTSPLRAKACIESPRGAYASAQLCSFSQVSDKKCRGHELAAAPAASAACVTAALAVAPPSTTASARAMVRRIVLRYS
jgi:hypothetical protein